MKNPLCAIGVAACLTGMVTAGTAMAAGSDCTLSQADIMDMEATRRLHSIADSVGTPRNGSPVARVVTLGYVIGRQALHLGDDPGRQMWFTCIQDAIVTSYAATLLLAGESPVPLDRTFQSAVLGLLDDQQMKDASIDPDAEVGSVFDVDWSGVWTAQAQSKTIHKFKAGVRLTFDLDVPEVVVSVVSGKGAEQALPLSVSGSTVSFEHPVGTEHRWVWTLRHEDQTCSGGITTYGPNIVIEWDVISCERRVE